MVLDKGQNWKYNCADAGSFFWKDGCALWSKISNDCAPRVCLTTINLSWESWKSTTQDTWAVNLISINQVLSEEKCDKAGAAYGIAL